MSVLRLVISPASGMPFQVMESSSKSVVWLQLNDFVGS